MAAEVLEAAAPCFHCGLPVPPGLRLSAKVFGQAQPMCCIGCVAVAEMLEAQGLSDWYRRREGAPGVRAPELSGVRDRVAFLETPSLEQDYVDRDPEGETRASLLVEGLSCAACLWIIERHLGSLDGVHAVRVGLASRRVSVEYDGARVGLRDLILRLAEIGFAARPDRPGGGADLERREQRSALIRLGVAGLGAMNVMTYSVALYAGAFEGMSEGAVALMRFMGLLVSTPVVFVSARPFFEAAWREVRVLAPGMDVPVALAIGGAYIVSLYATFAGTGEVYFDSVCMFTFFLSVGRFLEMRIRHRSASLTRSLIDAAPLIARREEEGGERVVPAQALVVGDRFRVRPGETLPADGRVIEGRSSVEEALLTGEPWPRSVEVGHAVVAGSMNVESPILVEATRVGDATTLASIVALIERAQSERPPIAQLADRVARIFVAVVLAVACLDFVVWRLIAPEQAVWTTLAVLVATCPCALSLATPTAIAAATHALARAGLLITRARALEGLVRSDRFVFDKTGTLTSGQPALVRIVPLRDCDEDLVLDRARSLEADSEHPVAHAFARSASDRPRPISRRATEVQAQPGFGVEGRVDGVRYRIGRPEWAAALAPSPPLSQESQESQPGRAPPGEHDGLVWVLLADESGPLAWFGLDDPIRPDAANALARLRETGRTLEMLSGDPSPAAARVAERLGLEVAIAAATPVGKVERVRALQRAGHRVVVVGDGVNDGPLLQAGDVSIAMGSGCDLSRLTADAVLIRDDLSLLPRAVECARRVRRIMFQNFGWAFAYNLLVLPLAVTGHLAPWLAALGMSGSSLVVVVNALRLNRLPEAS